MASSYTVNNIIEQDNLNSGINDFILFSHICHLLEDTDGRISRSELEQILNYSGNYLNTIVKKYTHKCLFDYGQTFCMKKAATLLKRNNFFYFRNYGRITFY